MATGSVIHFATCNGETVQLTSPWYSDLKQDFESIIGFAYNGRKLIRDCQLFAFGYCPTCGKAHPTERRINFAKHPSMHVCSAKCQAAKGPNCECSCAGKNHGKAA